MKGSFKETESLGTLFGAIADVLEQREEMLLERIALLEEKIGQLEEKIARLEENALYFEDAEDEVAEYGEESCDEAVQEELSAGNEEYAQEEDDEYPDKVVEDAECPAEEEAAVEQHEEEEAAEGYKEGADDAAAEEYLAEDEDMAEEMEAHAVEEVVAAEEPVQEVELPEDELPEMELEFEFELDDEDFEETEVEEQHFEEVAEDGTGEGDDDVRFDDKEVLVLDKVRPDWYDWEVDIPGHYIDDIREGIGLNDKILFMRELFGGSVEVFNEAIDDLNGMRNLVETVEYLRERFPEWDEESDEVYRFYMTVRRRFNKQK